MSQSRNSPACTAAPRCWPPPSSSAFSASPASRPSLAFFGKLSLLTAALGKGHLLLVVVTMLNAAVAVYYYLRVVKEAVFGDPTEAATGPISLDAPTRILCVALIVVIVALGVAPATVIDTISQSLSGLNLPVAGLAPR
jgi:NADH-quinone oxidoreductase subunit N